MGLCGTYPDKQYSYCSTGRNFTICTKPFIQYNNEFDFHENEHVGRIHFHMNDFAHRLVLTLRGKVTQKWSIEQTEGDILVCTL